MKVTLDLPEYTVDNDYGRDPHYNPGLCAGCEEERDGLMVKLHPVGWLHTESEDLAEPSCLQRALDRIAASEPRAAWTAVAKHVAKYPSRHGASAIRAVLTELTRA